MSLYLVSFRSYIGSCTLYLSAAIDPKNFNGELIKEELFLDNFHANITAGVYLKEYITSLTPSAKYRLNVNYTIYHTTHKIAYINRHIQFHKFMVEDSASIIANLHLIKYLP
jgi:hypothetical protein